MTGGGEEGVEGKEERAKAIALILGTGMPYQANSLAALYSTLLAFLDICRCLVGLFILGKGDSSLH